MNDIIRNIGNDMNKQECERLKNNRSYFEDGCICIIDKIIDLKSNDVTDIEAVKYYEKNCICIRNYVGK